LDVPDEIIRGVAELGLFGLSIPEEFGGSLSGRPDNVAMLIATEELSAASLAAGGSLMTRPEILVRALLSGATEDQKRRWLPGIATGENLVAVAVAGCAVAPSRLWATADCTRLSSSSTATSCRRPPSSVRRVAASTFRWKVSRQAACRRRAGRSA